MSTPHVPVPKHLRLPAQFEHVPGYLAMVDPDLRIRRSVEVPHTYVIERRCRRAPAVNAGMRDTSDLHVQARDGYIHVTRTNDAWLTKPWNIVRDLKTEGADLWAEGGAAKFDDELRYEEAWMRESRKRRRYGLYRDIARDARGPMQRLNIDGSRPRIANVGTSPHAG